MSKKTLILTMATLGLALNANALFAEPPKEVKELDIDITIVGENDTPNDVVNQIQLPDFSNLPKPANGQATQDNNGNGSEALKPKSDPPGKKGLERALEKAPGLQNNPGLETREQVLEQVRERISGKGKDKKDIGLPPEVEEIVERARGRSDEKKPDKEKPEKPETPGS